MLKNLSLIPFWRWALVLALLFTLGVFILGPLLRFWRAHRPPTRAILWTVGAFIAGVVVTAFGPPIGTFTLVGVQWHTIVLDQ